MFKTLDISFRVSIRNASPSISSSRKTWPCLSFPVILITNFATSSADHPLIVCALTIFCPAEWFRTKLFSFKFMIIN